MPALRPFDPADLAAPLAGASPCGPALDYDAAFQALEVVGAGKPEREPARGHVIPAEPPDWNEVEGLARALADRTRDLRVAQWLLRGSTHRHGLAGATAGLELIHALLANHWPALHPALDDDGDATGRLNALDPLRQPDALLADLRSSPLLPLRQSMRLREVELALGADKPWTGEPVPDASSLQEATRMMLAEHPDHAGLALALAQSAAAAVDGIGECLRARVGDDTAGSLDLGPLRRLLGAAVQLLERATTQEASAPGGASSTAAEGASAAVAVPTAGGPDGCALASRTDVVRELDRICSWLETHEPANPAPLLLRRGQRLVAMDFLAILDDLAPEAVAGIRRLAGAASDPTPA